MIADGGTFAVYLQTAAAATVAAAIVVVVLVPDPTHPRMKVRVLRLERLQAVLRQKKLGPLAGLMVNESLHGHTPTSILLPISEALSSMRWPGNI